MSGNDNKIKEPETNTLNFINNIKIYINEKEKK